MTRPLPAFCASCVEESSDLRWVRYYDGREVALCRECRLGTIKPGGASFGSGPSWQRTKSKGGVRRHS